MVPGFQSSFIPKDPITPDVFKKKKTGFFGVLAISLFIISILFTIGVMFYKNSIKDNIITLQSDLAEAEKSIDKASIKEMLQFSQKLGIVKSIVNKHQVISGFLSSLSASTVATVYFTEFNYSSFSPDGLTINMEGKANSYGSIALQESVFMKNKYWKSVSISDLSLEDKGAVSFQVVVVVDPEIAVYVPDASSPIITNPVPDNSASSTVSLDGLDDVDLGIDNL